MDKSDQDFVNAVTKFRKPNLEQENAKLRERIAELEDFNTRISLRITGITKGMEYEAIKLPINHPRRPVLMDTASKINKLLPIIPIEPVEEIVRLSKKLVELENFYTDEQDMRISEEKLRRKAEVKVMVLEKTLRDAALVLRYRVNPAGHTQLEKGGNTQEWTRVLHAIESVLPVSERKDSNESNKG